MKLPCFVFNKNKHNEKVTEHQCPSVLIYLKQTGPQYKSYEFYLLNIMMCRFNIQIPFCYYQLRVGLIMTSQL